MDVKFLDQLSKTNNDIGRTYFPIDISSDMNKKMIKLDQSIKDNTNNPKNNNDPTKATPSFEAKNKVIADFAIDEKDCDFLIWGAFQMKVFEPKLVDPKRPKSNKAGNGNELVVKTKARLEGTGFIVKTEDMQALKLKGDAYEKIMKGVYTGLLNLLMKAFPQVQEDSLNVNWNDIVNIKSFIARVQKRWKSLTKEPSYGAHFKFVVIDPGMWTSLGAKEAIELWTYWCKSFLRILVIMYKNKTEGGPALPDQKVVGYGVEEIKDNQLVHTMQYVPIIYLTYGAEYKADRNLYSKKMKTNGNYEEVADFIVDIMRMVYKITETKVSANMSLKDILSDTKTLGKVVKAYARNKPPTKNPAPNAKRRLADENLIFDMKE